jgi:hypothetical protein
MFDTYSGIGFGDLVKRIAGCQNELAQSQNASWEDIELHYEDDYGSAMIAVTGTRPETDNEYDRREQSEAFAKQSREIAELQQYQALKAKFEGK